MIELINNNTILKAASIHSASWIAAHSFCSAEFIANHTPESQELYLRNEIKNGKHLYILSDKGIYIGIVSVFGDLIENLYVEPSFQGKGYGTELLLFAILQCKAEPVLWILENNFPAYKFYTKHGFYKTGKYNKLSGALSEIEMKKPLQK